MMKEIAILFEELCQKLSFFIALSLALLSQAQRNKYIELRSGNPLLRMRSDVPLVCGSLCRSRTERRVHLNSLRNGSVGLTSTREITQERK